MVSENVARRTNMRFCALSLSALCFVKDLHSALIAFAERSLVSHAGLATPN
jgi:hypothetical protein